MEVKAFSLGPLETNCFLIHRNGEAVVVDPGGDPDPVLRYLKSKGLKLTHILNTHLHFDHTAGNSALASATGAPILASDKDAPLLETELGLGGFMGFPGIEEYEYQSLEPGDLELLGLSCKVLAVPGHSQGSVAFYFPDCGHLFSGDLVFSGSIGRTDFPGGSFETLIQSVRKEVFSLPDETIIHPGHGPNTTVGQEKLHNPFFSDFKF